MYAFKWNYFLIFILLLAAEITIAIFHFNPFVRGFLGDVLVVLLLYCFLKIYIRNNVLKTALAVLTFALFIEFLQYFKLAEILNIESKIILTLLGSVFDMWDLLAYFIGFLIIMSIEKLFCNNTLSYFFNL